MSKLHVDSIRKQVGGRQLLSNVFLTCSPGEIIGLLGRNGAGKSTLLKIIFGIEKAENNYIAIDGKKVNALNDNNKLLAYLPQDSFLPNHVQVKHLIQCICTKTEAAILGNEPIVASLLDRKAPQLSGGEKRMIEVMMLLHSQAKYVLLDEPFTGLSPLHVHYLKEVILKHSKHKGIILTDHHYKNVLAICTNVILLDDGHTRIIKNPKDLETFGYLPLNEDHLTSTSENFSNLAE